MDGRTQIYALPVTLSLLVLGAGAVEAQSSQAVAIAGQPVMSEACAVTQEQCTVDCLGRSERNDMMACLIGCDNPAALCGRDPEEASCERIFCSCTGPADSEDCNEITGCIDEIHCMGHSCGCIGGRVED